MDPNAVLDGEWSRSTDGCIRWGGDRRRGRGIFGVNLGRLIVTNGNGDALFPNDFGRTYFASLDSASRISVYSVHRIGRNAYCK